MNHILRPPVPDDANFIYNSWLNHYRETENKLSNGVYYEKFKRILTTILERSLVIIVCNKDDQAQIYGYVVYEPGNPVIMHYIYIKSTYRRFGHATELIGKIRQGEDPIVCTFATWVFKKLKKKWRLTYNPWLR